MANTLQISKLNGGYFEFILNSETPIKNFRNDLFAVGEELHFKTANGANLIKQQQVFPSNVTLISGGTFTFTSVSDLFEKLVEVGYFDWFIGGGTGIGVDRFTDLIDTFPSYVGKDMQCVVVDESQLKLKTVPFYNKQFIAEMNDFEGVLQANKMVTTNASGTKFILEDKPTPPQQYLNSVGYFDYSDSATVITPLNIVSGVPLLFTNDTLGVYTSYSNAPYGISNVYNGDTNQFDFTQLSIGDSVDIRLDFDVTTSINNQTYRVFVVLGVGSPSEFTKEIKWVQVKNAGLHTNFFDIKITMDYQDIIDSPAEIYIESDNNGTFVNNGYKVYIIRKNINIINVETGVENATSSVLGVIRLNNDLGGTAENPTVPALATKEPIIASSSINNVLVGDKTWVNLEGWVTGFLTNTWLGNLFVSLASKSLPVDSDTMPISDSQDSFKAKKLTLFNLKSFLTSYYDTIYTKFTSFKTINGTSIIGSGNLIVTGGTTISNATNITSGIVKTDISQADPIVYTKTTSDSLLSGKQNALGYTPENVANKQNSLTIDGTGVKYATVDATNAGLALKANDNAVVHFAGAETITGKKTYTATYVNAQASFGSINQAGIIHFARGSDGLIGHTIGYASATETNGLRIDATGGSAHISFAKSGVDKLRMSSGGRFLVNTTTDNGIDAGQFNGTVSGSDATLSNQFVTKSQLDTVNTGAMLLTGNQTFTGTKTSTTTTNQIFALTNNSSSIGASAITIDIASTATQNGSRGITIQNNNTGTLASSSQCIYMINATTGYGNFTKNLSTGIGNLFENWSSGDMTIYNAQTGATGNHVVFKKLNTQVAKIDVNGNATFQKYNLNTGSNASAGNATLVAGTVTVTTTAATSNSLIQLTIKTAGGTVGTYLTYTTTTGSFTITSQNSLDTSTVTYLIIN